MNTVTLNSMAFDNFEVTNAKFLAESVGGVNEVVAGSACAWHLVLLVQRFLQVQDL